MTSTFAVWLVIISALIGANLPWLSSRVFLIFSRANGKSSWLRLLEWFCYYWLVGLLAAGIERKLNGNIYHQGWEFYWVNLFVFAIFALPGFIYHYQIRRPGTGE